MSKADNVLHVYRDRGLKIATAESCTGGLIAGALTDIPGSSAVFDRGFVTYSNEAKMDMLGVPRHLIETHGAVSREVACAMAEGALAHSLADIALSVTGIAGPDGGSVEKPVGFVWYGVASRGGQTISGAKNFSGNRTQIRQAAVDQALSYLLAQLA